MRGEWVVLVLVVVVAAAAYASAPPLQPPANTRKTVLSVGYLTAIKGNMRDRQGLAISGAITMALKEINDNPELLPQVELQLKWNDTKGDMVLGARAVTDMICDGVVAFFGPEGSCHVEAIISQSKNIPMISYKCADHKPTGIPTFARTEPPDKQVAKSIISLLRYYRWHKFSIIHEERWLTVALNLENHAKKNNMTVNHLRSVLDQHQCCEQHLPCCNAGYWYQLIQETKNRTRIYVYLGLPSSLTEFMMSMDAAQLFTNGEYMVIFVDMLTYSPKEAQKYLWKPEQMTKITDCSDDKNFKKRARSLLVIVSTPPVDSYKDFAEEVQKFNTMEPFHFSVPPIFNKNNFVKFVSIYAAYLYDSVKIYAESLHYLLLSEKNLTPGKIKDVALNGSRLIDSIKNRTYISITGATIRFDESGDSEGNFSVLALKPGAQVGLHNFSCDHLMVPVGHFQQGSKDYDYPTYKLNPRLPIDWPNNEKPADEPSCGFMNEHCPKEDTHVSSMVVAVTLAVTLFCASVITVSIYRKWKIEQEIEGLLWKIDSHEIRGYIGNDMIASPSKLSLASGGSFESRCGAQVFAATGLFRGNVVRIKELKFSKKKDISRDIMKEMRLLRDLRHDNLNSFIGACVEPMRILLITDYCAKGSLYDIIENEDIKLDSMFVASLVHDLIKGMCFIHSSPLGWHGNLKSSNCVVTSRWMLQVTDFGLHDIRHSAENDSIGEHQYYRSLFWKAPENLRATGNSVLARGSQKSDVYAFAIILYEIVGRKGPFGLTPYEPKEIIELVKRYPSNEGDEPFRPDIYTLDSDTAEDCIIQCMQDCWAEDPDNRPDFHNIRVRLKKMKSGKNRNIMDQIMDMMEKYANNLEELVNERTRLLYEEKQKTEDLLHRMLPQPVAKRLTTGHGVEPESFDSVTIYFSDIVGFTQMSAESTPLEVVNFLNDLYTVFDRIIKGYDVYKVETIGDAYMVVSGLPLRNDDRHAGEIASMSLDLLDAVKNHQISHRPNKTLKLRIGIHTGPVVAGVVGLTMPRYCLFGDTVNTASRMESNGEALKIHISPQCKEALERLEGYYMRPRGTINIKGKGEVMTYWLEGANEKAIQRRAVDLGELPPLFCRPRRSPKLSDSRQASIYGNFGGLSSRRQSAVRGLEIGSSISLSQNSPKLETELPQKTRILSSISSSADERELPLSVKSEMSPNIYLREARSLDVLRMDSPNLRSRKVSRSLDRCNLISHHCPLISTVSGNHNSKFINGNATVMGFESNEPVDLSLDISPEECPLLHNPGQLHDASKLPHSKKSETNSVSFPSKKWKSLETVCETEIAHPGRKVPRASFKFQSWLMGIFNASGLRTSDGSLRKAIPLIDRESVV